MEKKDGVGVQESAIPAKALKQKQSSKAEQSEQAATRDKQWHTAQTQVCRITRLLAVTR